MVAITAVSAYVVDAYPESPIETGMWLVFLRTTGGFMASYIQASNSFLLDIPSLKS